MMETGCAGKLVRGDGWKVPGLTEEMKEAVSKAMHAALHRVGEITEENAPKLADNRTVQKLLKS